MPNQAQRFIAYLRKHDLCLATAESCTAGTITSLLAEVPGCGTLMDCGYVVYSVAAKKRLLGVKQKTIDRYTLTSEQVAREMALGALRDANANVAIATTGSTGPEPVDGVAPGTICFAWAFSRRRRIVLFSETKRFRGERAQLSLIASRYALRRFAYFHRRFLASSLT